MNAYLARPYYEVKPSPERDAVTIRITPPTEFGRPVHVDLTRDQFERFVAWGQGLGNIQDLLPDVSPRQRDMLLSGVAL